MRRAMYHLQVIFMDNFPTYYLPEFDVRDSPVLETDHLCKNISVMNRVIYKRLTHFVHHTKNAKLLRLQAPPIPSHSLNHPQYLLHG